VRRSRGGGRDTRSDRTGANHFHSGRSGDLGVPAAQQPAAAAGVAAAAGLAAAPHAAPAPLQAAPALASIPRRLRPMAAAGGCSTAPRTRSATTSAALPSSTAPWRHTHHAAHCVTDGDGSPPAPACSSSPGTATCRAVRGVDVTAAARRPRFVANADIEVDVAFLTVTRADSPPIQAITGAFRMPPPRSPIRGRDPAGMRR